MLPLRSHSNKVFDNTLPFLFTFQAKLEVVEGVELKRKESYEMCVENQKENEQRHNSILQTGKQ